VATFAFGAVVAGDTITGRRAEIDNAGRAAERDREAEKS
jgi:hypothetical protein